MPAGNVGIGTTSPGYKLDVAGTLNSSGNVTTSGSVTASGRVRSNESSGGFYKHHTDGTFRAAFYDDNSNTQIYADGDGSNPFITFSGGATHTTDIDGVLNISGTNRAIKMNGANLIGEASGPVNFLVLNDTTSDNVAAIKGTSAAILPSTNAGADKHGTMNLGSSSVKFANLFLSNSVSASVYKIGTTTVIDSSGNLTNIGSISTSGNVDAGGRVKATNWIELESSGASLSAEEAGLRWDYNDTPLWYFYKDNANDGALHIQSAATSGENDASPRVRFHRTARETYFGGAIGVNKYSVGSGLKLDVAGAIGISGTTVIDSSRVLQNVTFTKSILPTELKNVHEMAGPNAILKMQETDVTNTPTWWTVADGGTWSVRLNNTGTYPISIATNTNNNAVSQINIGYTTIFGGNIVGGDIKASSSAGLTLQTDEGTKRIEILDSGVVKFNQAYSFPTSDGSANQVLQTDGSGNLSFATVSGGGGGGVSISNNVNNRVLTGDGTNANAEANLTFGGTNLTIAGTGGVIADKFYFGATNSSLLAKDSANIKYMADGQHTFQTYDGGWVTKAQITDSDFQVLDGNIQIGTLGSTASGNLYLNGSTANKRAEIGCTNGNLHIDADHGNGIYLNWYGAQSATTTAGTYFGNANAGQVGRIDGSGNLTLSGTIECGAIDATASVEEVIRVNTTFSSGAIHFRESDVIRGLIGFSNGSSIYGGADDQDMVFRSEAKLHLVSNTSNLGLTISGGNATFGGNVDLNNHLVINSGVRGVAKNYADSSGWVKDTDGFGAMTGYYGGNFGVNGSNSEQSMDYGTTPDGSQALIWTATGDSTSGADGGWNKGISDLRDDTTYMSVTYVRRNGSSTSGNFYHGCSGSHTLNLDGTSNGNPYFSAIGINNLPQDVWCVSIGYIRANDNSSTAEDSTGGIYRCDTGEKITENTTFKMGGGSTQQTHRTYLYYSTTGTSSLSWFKPGFYEVNGLEPTVKELIDPGAGSLQNPTFNRVVSSGLYGTGHGASLLPIWQYNSSNHGYGFGYTEGSPDHFDFDVSGQLTSGTPDFQIYPNEARVNGNAVIVGGSASNASNLTITGVMQANNGYKVGSTTRINSVGDGIFTSLYIGSTNIVDTNKNLTNIGTISSGALAVSGQSVFTGAGTSNTYQSVIKTVNSSSDQWGHITLSGAAANNITNNFYLIGRGSSVADREMSFHIPTAANYGSGSQPKFRFASSGSDTLMTITASTGAVDVKGNITLGGTVDGRDVAADGTKLDGISANAVNASTTALSNYMRLNASTDVTNYSHIHTFYSNTSLATSSGSQSSLQCYVNGSGNDAFMTFHVGGDFACYFGLDGGTNKLSVGGWSMGANSYEIYHAGNKPSLATLGFTGASNANYITNNNQLTNGAGYITSSGTAANATQAGGLNVHNTQGTQNTANQIVRTQNNGYTMLGWINTTSGSTTTAMDRIYASNDGYIRYYTPANFLNSGGMADKLFNNQNRTHSSITNFNTSMTAGVHYLQQGTNGPTGTSSHQFYGMKFGLGSEYSAGTQYSAQMYFPRAAQGGGNGLYFRDMENGSWGSWRQVDAGTVGTLALKPGASATGANQIIRSHSNNYIYHGGWIEIAANGIYSASTNGAHFRPNQTTSYATWATSGARGGYDGILFDGGGDTAVMFDGSGNGGFYRQASSRWYNYHHVANACTGFNSSTTSSSYAIYVNGAIYASGDIVGSSDERLKTEIKTIPNALDKVLKLRGVTYKWKDTTEGGTCVNNITETRMGVIAQEIVEVLPEVVTHDKENDRYGVSYGHLTGVLIEAVKELKQEVNELKKELEEVKNG